MASESRLGPQVGWVLPLGITGHGVGRTHSGEMGSFSWGKNPGKMVPCLDLSAVRPLENGKLSELHLEGRMWCGFRALTPGVQRSEAHLYSFKKVAEVWPPPH